MAEGRISLLPWAAALLLLLVPPATRAQLTLEEVIQLETTSMTPGPDAAPVYTMVEARPATLAELSAGLLADEDGDGIPNGRDPDLYPAGLAALYPTPEDAIVAGLEEVRRKPHLLGGEFGPLVDLVAQLGYDPDFVAMLRTEFPDEEEEESCCECRKRVFRECLQGCGDRRGRDKYHHRWKCFQKRFKEECKQTCKQERKHAKEKGKKHGHGRGHDDGPRREDHREDGPRGDHGSPGTLGKLWKTVKTWLGRW